jgi:hypothetical protein
MTQKWCTPVSLALPPPPYCSGGVNGSGLSWASARLVHEDDVHCIADTVCQPDNSGSAVLQCYYPPRAAIASGASASPTPTCAPQFYICSVGVPSQILDVALGTACYNGAIVHANDVVCRNPSYRPPPCNCGVGGRLTCAGLSSAQVAVDPAVSGPLAAVLAACASGNCSAASTVWSATLRPGEVTAADVAFSNVTDPTVILLPPPSEATGRRALPDVASSSGNRRRVGGGLRRRASDRPALDPAELITFSEPVNGGLPLPLTINPNHVANAVAAAAATAASANAGCGRQQLQCRRHLAWAADIAAKSLYTPPTAPVVRVCVWPSLAISAPLLLLYILYLPPPLVRIYLPSPLPCCRLISLSLHKPQRRGGWALGWRR